MSPKTTLIVAVIALALGAYIYRYEWEPLETDTNPEREEIFEFEAEKIQEIEIRRAEGEGLKLQRSGEEAWQLLAPVEAAADTSASDSLAESVATLESERVVAGGEVNLADFGLASPKLELELKIEDAEKPTTLFIGDETPIGSNLYARLADGDKILVIASSSKYSLDKKAWDLRDKSVFHFDRADVEKVVLRQPEQELVLAKASEDSWNLVEPTFSRADRYKASGLVSALETSKMEEVVSESIEDPGEYAQYGLASPSYEVEVQLEGGLTEKLLVGKEKDTRYYARNPDRSMVYLVATSLVDEIKKGESEFLSKRLFDFATYQANKFQISSREGPDRVFEKSKQDEQDVWKETAPEALDRDRTKVEDLLYKLNGTDAEETIKEAPGLDAPDYTITVWSKDGGRVEEVAIAKPEGDAVYARRKGDELILKLSASSWEEIEKLMSFEEEDESAEAPEGPGEPEEKDEEKEEGNQ
jgi:hypothetical protein